MTEVIKLKAFVYQFPAQVDRWRDGDTVVVHRGAKPGEIIHEEHVRIHGLDAPELSHEGGAASRDHAILICPPGTDVTLVASREDKFGRFLARVVLEDGSDFTERMIAAGHGKHWLP